MSSAGEDFDLSSFHLPSSNSNNHDDELLQQHSDLSQIQYVFLIMSLWSGSILNIIGSTTILYSVRLRRRRPQQKQQQHSSSSGVYHRLLTVMSIFEICNSVNYIIMPFMPPASTPGLYWASGNTISCSISGFIGLFMLLPTWIYSGYLSIYFLLIIRFNWTEQQISRQLEIPAFLFAIGISLWSAINGLLTQSFNARPSELLCLTEQYPYNCHEDPTIECERGGGEGRGVITSSGFLVVTSLVSSGVGLICTVIIYWTVYSTYLLNNNTTTTTTVHHHHHDYRLRVVAKQSALYFLIYLNVLLWPIATELMYGISNVSKEDRGSAVSYTYDLIGWFFYSFQGFLNCCVYLKPRYEQWRCSTEYNNKGRIWAIRKAIGTDPLPTKKAARYQQQSAGTITPSMKNSSNKNKNNNSNSSMNKQEDCTATDVSPETPTRFVSSSSNRSWRTYAVWFPLPEIFPYHISAGFSVGQGISSSSDLDDPSSSCFPNINGDEDIITTVEHRHDDEEPGLQLQVEAAEDGASIVHKHIQSDDDDDSYSCCVETAELPSDDDPAVLLPVVGQSRLVLKTEKDQQIDQIVQ